VIRRPVNGKLAHPGFPVRFPLVKFTFHLLLLPALALPVQGLFVRGYTSTDHDRFTGFPASPVMNPGFIYDASKFTGVGYITSGGDGRQFTLVTPRHVLCASHYRPSAGVDQVRFVDTSGTVITRSFTAVTMLLQAPGTNSDLALCTLDAPLPPTVAVYPYLNLANEAAYIGQEITVLGFYAKGARGSIADFDTVGFSLPSLEAFASRCFYFDYNTTSGGANDCHFQIGDSGSPSFAMVAGEPALVGIHGLTNTVGTIISNYDTFVPHYVAKVDAQLQSSGYRLAPANFTATTLSIPAASASPGTLRRSHPGEIVFSLGNTGAELTGNVAVTVTFPVGQQPSSLSGPGWVVESGGSGIWNLRAATLAGGASLDFTATWTELPDVAAVNPGISADSDTATAILASPSFTLAPSYAEWAEGLALPGQTADPDGDSLENLLEYALGGDAESGAMILPGGQPLLPVMTHQAGTVTLSFPERDDALVRGLSYIVETSTSPATLAGATTLPAGASSSTAPFSPAVPGFVKRTLTWPADGPKRFARVKVALTE
jgi:hypothetical protein